MNLSDSTQSNATQADTLSQEESASVSASVVDLKDPLLAAGLALVLPGLGHFYQRRTAKAILFFVCILGTYLYGWDIGGQRVVYASWRDGDRRWHYLGQFWIGLPAWPALLQTGADPPLGDFMRPPRLHPDEGINELDVWNKESPGLFELGSVFTVVAGLLNLLVIFDAAAGPLGSVPSEEKKKSGRREQEKEDASASETAASQNT